MNAKRGDRCDNCGSVLVYDLDHCQNCGLGIYWLHGWKEDLWAQIAEGVPEGEKFALGWAYGLDKTLGQLHPENKNVRPKIRQVLQQLVAEGRLERLSPGLYRRVA